VSCCDFEHERTFGRDWVAEREAKAKKMAQDDASAACWAPAPAPAPVIEPGDNVIAGLPNPGPAIEPTRSELGLGDRPIADCLAELEVLWRTKGDETLFRAAWALRHEGVRWGWVAKKAIDFSKGTQVFKPQDPVKKAFYVAIRMDHKDPHSEDAHRLADMLSSQRPPMSSSDREYMEGMLERQAREWNHSPHIGEFYESQAKAQGVDTTGKYYEAGLARFPGDGKAWITGKGDVLRVAAENGMSVTGAVTVKGREMENPPEDTLVADDLVANRMLQRVEADPGLAHKKDLREVFEETREMMAPQW
jgi:hypothetical protein